jgi:hypothetical protein
VNRRYEITDDGWERLRSLLPPKKCLVVVAVGAALALACRAGARRQGRVPQPAHPGRHPGLQAGGPFHRFAWRGGRVVRQALKAVKRFVTDLYDRYVLRYEDDGVW